MMSILRANYGAFVLYVVFHAGLGTLIEASFFTEKFVTITSSTADIFSSFSVLMIVIGLGWYLTFIVADFFLFKVVLNRAGIRGTFTLARFALFACLYLAVLIATVCGAFLLILPGLLFFGRLFIAPLIFLAEDIRFTDALHESWETIDGYTRWVLLSYIIVTVGFIGAGLGLDFTETVDPSSTALHLSTIIIAHTISSLSTAGVALIGLSVFFFLREPTRRLREVFT